MDIIQKLANAYVTYVQCFGHHKAAMNERRVKDYKEELTQAGTPIPTDEELGKLGQFNGEGSY